MSWQVVVYVVISLIAANVTYALLEGYEEDEVIRLMFSMGGGLLWPVAAVVAVLWVLTLPARWLVRKRP